MILYRFIIIFHDSCQHFRRDVKRSRYALLFFVWFIALRLVSFSPRTPNWISILNASLAYVRHLICREAIAKQACESTLTPTVTGPGLSKTSNLEYPKKQIFHKNDTVYLLHLANIDLLAEPLIVARHTTSTKGKWLNSCDVCDGVIITSEKQHVKVVQEDPLLSKSIYL